MGYFQKCTGARIILAVLSPVLLAMGLWNLLIAVEQFNIAGLMTQVSPDGKVIGQGSYVQDYNQAILTGLKITPMDWKVGHPSPDGPTDNTSAWLSCVIAHVPMLMLSNVDEQLKPEFGKLIKADSIVPTAKKSLIIAACMTIVQALGFIVAAIASAIFGFFCGKKNSCLLNAIHTPTSVLTSTLLLCTIIQIACSDYVTKLKDGSMHYSLLLSPNGFQDGKPFDGYNHIKTNVYVLLPFCFGIALLATLAACCACDPVDDEDEDDDQNALPRYSKQQFVPQQAQYGHYTQYPGQQQFVSQQPMQVEQYSPYTTGPAVDQSMPMPGAGQTVTYQRSVTTTTEPMPQGNSVTLA